MHLPTNVLQMLTKKVQIKNWATPDILNRSEFQGLRLPYCTLCKRSGKFRQVRSACASVCEEGSSRSEVQWGIAKRELRLTLFTFEVKICLKIRLLKALLF